MKDTDGTSPLLLYQTAHCPYSYEAIEDNDCLQSTLRKESEFFIYEVRVKDVTDLAKNGKPVVFHTCQIFDTCERDWYSISGNMHSEIEYLAGKFLLEWIARCLF